LSVHKAIWTGAREPLERASVALTDILFPPADAVSLTKDDAAAADEASGWKLEAYFAARPDEAALAAALQKNSASLPAPQIETLPDIDWVAHALEGLGIVRAGRFVLYGAHDADKLDAACNEGADDDIAIQIDANQAFGTGHHPTTAGCLTLLGRFAGFRPGSILDLGCGSAVLSIAAAKMWDREVLASDIDARSVEIAAENAAINGVGDMVSVIEADGFSHAAIADGAPFDFVFANILAGPLVELAPAMAGHTAKNGRIMLAGLMSEQETTVTTSYEKAGFRLINRLDQETWPVLLFVRQ